MSLFDILIQGSNNKGFFMQISTVIRQLKRMTSLTKITCAVLCQRGSLSTPNQRWKLFSYVHTLRHRRQLEV